MNIAIDTSPLYSADKFRGVGSYTRNFLAAVKQYDKANKYYEISPAKAVTKNHNLFIIPYFYPFSITLPLFKKVKTIITIHDLIPLKFSKYFPVGIRGSLMWHIQKQLLATIDGIITDSKVSREDIIKITGVREDKIFTVYPAISSLFKPVDDKNILTKVRKKYSLPDKFVLYVGDCNWNKNIPTLIKAVKELNANLILVGKVFTDTNTDLSHPWNSSLNKVLELSQNDHHIKRLGFIAISDLVALYNLATLYVQPSFYEGFGLSVIEAFNCGCPVLSSKGGSLTEIGGEAAEYFNPSDLNELSDKINRMINDSNLKAQMSKKGLKQAKKFSSKEFVKSLHEIYKKII